VGGNVEKGTIVCVDNALKLYLGMFAKSQWEKIKLDYQIFIGNTFVACKCSMNIFLCKLKMFQESFYMFKRLKTCLWTFIPIPNVDQSFQKLEKILMLMIKQESWLEIQKIHVYNKFWSFWFKCVFDLENSDFWWFFLTKKIILIC
jgi:hypothetical protein